MLRWIFCVVFLLLALLFATGLATLVIEGTVQHPLRSVSAGCMAVSCLLTTVYCLRSPKSWLSGWRCPACAAQAMEPGRVKFQRIGPITFLFGGFLYLLWVKARPRNLVCAECHHTMAKRTMGSWVAMVWLITFVVGIIDGMANS
jgi:hypothetical protein